MDIFSGVPIEDWMLLSSVYVVVMIICLATLKGAWVVVVWLPSFVIAVLYTCVLLIEWATASSASGPESGWLFMGLWFQMIYSSPIIISVVVLLFARPPRDAWRSSYATPAVIATVIAVLCLIRFVAAHKAPVPAFPPPQRDIRRVALPHPPLQLESYEFHKFE